jgi:hypothetical protein
MTRRSDKNPGRVPSTSRDDSAGQSPAPSTRSPASGTARAWTTPEALTSQVLREWKSGRLLRAVGSGEPLFPMALRFRGPTSRELSERFSEVQPWIRALEAGSKPARGHGYELAWSDINHRLLGRNRVPSGAIVPTEDDALALARRGAEAARFRELFTETTARFPALAPWLVEQPLRALEHAGDWGRVLAVLDWFRAHPRAGVYLRQIEAEGVHTKFVEERKGLLAELLDRVLPPEAVDAGTGTGAAAFEARYGLRAKPTLVRLRVLDRRHLVAGLSDLTIPAADLGALRPAVARVFVTENEINGLAFPDVPGSLVIFGLGFGLGRLAQVSWLADVELHYWGDVDTHGFAMLDRLRAALPHAQSFLMDRASVLAHRTVWGHERDNERHLAPLARLTPDEAALYDDLVANRLADCLRLEQERISFGWLQRALAPFAR